MKHMINCIVSSLNSFSNYLCRSFRLQNKRLLKNLLMLKKGGCGRFTPGIGDISYVKDLQTEEIVTTKFRCSHFSAYHSKSNAGFGWVSYSGD